MANGSMCNNGRKNKPITSQPSTPAMAPYTGPQVPGKYRYRLGKGEASCRRAVDVGNKPGQEGVDILSGPVTKRNLKTLIGLKRFKCVQLGLPYHEESVRDAST